MFCLFVCLFFFSFLIFLSFLYSVIRYSLSSPPRIAMLTMGYNGLCNLIQGNKVCVCVFKRKTLVFLIIWKVAFRKCFNIWLFYSTIMPLSPRMNTTNQYLICKLIYFFKIWCLAEIFHFMSNSPLDYCRQGLEGIHDRIDPDKLQTFLVGH